MTTIYYLQWHRQDADRWVPATELFHEFNFDPPEALGEEEFDELYEEVADVETDDLNQLWAEWNRGSGYESEAFLEQEVRSMSVGDILKREGQYTAVAPVGWQDISVDADDRYLRRP